MTVETLVLGMLGVVVALLIVADLIERWDDCR